MQNVLLSVDTNCIIVIDSNHDDECGTMDDDTGMTESSSTSPIGGIVGGMVAVVLILTVIIVIAVVAALFLRTR